MKKYIITGCCIILLLISGFVWFVYNKAPQNIQEAIAIKVNANDLYKTFINDSAMARSQYTGKVLQVEGIITDISKNQQAQTIILLSAGQEGAGINCTLEQEPSDALKTGQVLTIKGYCSGIGTGDIDLGIPGDIYMGRCFVMQ